MKKIIYQLNVVWHSICQWESIPSIGFRALEVRLECRQLQGNNNNRHDAMNAKKEHNLIVLFVLLSSKTIEIFEDFNTVVNGSLLF